MLVLSQHMDLELDQCTTAVLYALEGNHSLVTAEDTHQQAPVMATKLVFTAHLTISVRLHAQHLLCNPL